MDWAAQASEDSDPDADDRGQDLVFWVEDGDPGDDYWIYATGWVTIMDGETVVGTKFATYKYNAAHDGPTAPSWSAKALFPTGTLSAGDTYKAYAMALDPASGDIYVAGEAPRQSQGATDQDYLVVKYDKDLNLEWSTYYNGPANGDDIPADIVFHDLGGDDAFAIVTGTSPGDGTGQDIATVALEADDGAPASDAWPSGGVRRYDGPDSGNDAAVELAPVIITIDDEDVTLQVVVLGTSWDDEDDYDYTTHVWSGTSSSPLWDQRYDYGDADLARGLWVEGAYIYVTGASQAPQGTVDYATISYHADQYGTPRWSGTDRRWDSGDDDYPHDIMVRSPPLAADIYFWVTGRAYDGADFDVGSVYYYENPDGPTLPGNPNFSAIWTSAAAWQFGGAVWVRGTEPYITGAAGTTGSDRMLAIKYKENTNPLYAEDWHMTFYDDPDFGNEGRAIIVVDDIPGSGPDIYITGYSTESGEGTQFTTWRYIDN